MRKFREDGRSRWVQFSTHSDLNVRNYPQCKCSKGTENGLLEGKWDFQVISINVAWMQVHQDSLNVQWEKAHFKLSSDKQPRKFEGKSWIWIYNAGSNSTVKKLACCLFLVLLCLCCLHSQKGMWWQGGLQWWSFHLRSEAKPVGWVCGLGTFQEKILTIFRLLGAFLFICLHFSHICDPVLCQKWECIDGPAVGHMLNLEPGEGVQSKWNKK